MEALESDWTTAPVEAKRKTMLDWVAKLTRTPGRMQREDVDSLRAVGFSDEDVLAICEVAGYYAYVNRIADGLGVDLESWFTDSETTETDE